MKGKTFLILLVATGLLVALWFFRFADDKQTGPAKMGDKLFADLPVNAVASVTLSDSENSVRLVKGDKVWQVESRNGYPANFDELRELVVKLSRLKIGRSFSASTESLARLSLMAPSAPDASTRGKQITMKDSSGKILADVIVGQSRKTDSGEGGGQYLKKADADTVFLVDDNFRFLKTAPAQWLKKEILDIKAEDVASVACFSGGQPAPVYTLSRPEQGEAARMTPVPPGRTADSAKIDQVLDALAPLTLDDVQPGDGKPPVAESELPRLVFRLYDGRQISIFPDAGVADTYTLRVAVADTIAETQAADSSEPQPVDGKTPAGEKTASAAKTARQLNEELRPWVFSVKKWQFDSFITQPGALLEEVKKQEGSSS